MIASGRRRLRKMKSRSSSHFWAIFVGFIVICFAIVAVVATLLEGLK